MDDQRAQLARLRMEMQALHARFTHVTSEYEAGRLTLSEEAVLLRDIIHATGAVMDQVSALVTE
jgi:hypothetical protein